MTRSVWIKCPSLHTGGGDRPSARGGSGKPALLDPPLPSGRWQPMWVRVGNIWPPRADRVVQGEEYDRIQCWLNGRIYDRGESGRV